MNKNLVSRLRSVLMVDAGMVCDDPDCADCEWYRLFDSAADEIEHLQRMTLLMAGAISTIGRWADMNPQDVYDEFYKEVHG